MSLPHFSTKDRILGAAEELFAQHGFAGTSLRQVTSRADVNIAAVNYHFGCKENLVNEVFRRRMDEMSARPPGQRCRRAVEAIPANWSRSWPPSSSQRWRWPWTAMAAAPSSGCSPAPTPRRTTACASSCPTTTATCCASSPRRIAGCVPALGKEELYWRLDFLAGALTYAMADFGLIKRPSGVSEATHRQRAAKALIRFAAAGFQADAT